MSKIRQKQIKRRSEILEKVMKLTEKTPFTELSIRDICEGTGISVGSFYHYFKEKSDLVSGLMELTDNFMAEQLLPQLTKESAMENLRFICMEFARYVLNGGLELAKLTFACKPNDVDDDGVRRPTLRMIESVVAQGQKNGEFRTDVSSEKITDMILIAISGVAIDWSRREASYDLLERMDEYVTFFFRSLMK